MNPRHLPIYEIEEPLREALAAGGRAVVQAPTGSGKSTQIPQMLLRWGLLEQGQVIVLQPRRLATRMLARRVAEELGSRLGGLAGYQIRLESRISAETRIRFVTEGILLRQMVDDSSLPGVAALIFDEFHERHLYGDITLGRALQIQRERRPDLKIIVMSATLDTAQLQNYLSPCATVRSEGRTFPVSIRYVDRAIDPERQPIWEAAAAKLEELLSAGAEGDALVFMPGAYEISRAVGEISRRLPAREFEVLPLHGELTSAEQDRAVGSSDRRKVIVSTNVAETSLTIEGVRIVIDGGLARVAAFDPRRGINTLLIEKISHASADQRAGRAGRTAPGICLRLWTEREHVQRPPRELPEVKRLDLSEVVLALKAGGVDDVRGFPWLEAPDPHGLATAERLLQHLGALDASGRINSTGRAMMRYPAHPRYARMLLEAERRGCLPEVALAAALTQTRSLLVRQAGSDAERKREEAIGDEQQSDFFALMAAFQTAAEAGFRLEVCRELGIHAQTARQVAGLWRQFLHLGRESEETADEAAGGDLTARRDEVRKCLLVGFSDQLGRRLDGGTLRCELVGGRRGTLQRESAVQRAKLLVAAEVSEIQGKGGEVNTLLGLVTAVEEAWLAELFPGDYRSEETVALDPSIKRVTLRRRRAFRDLVLEDREGGEAPEDAAAAILAREVLAGRCPLPNWDEGVDQFIARVNRLAKLFPEFAVSPIREEDRLMLLEQICHGARGYKDLKDAPVLPVLKQWLSREQLDAMETLLPERYDLPNGRRHKIRYEGDGPPVLAARIQDLYGIERNIVVASGRQPLKIEVLAPNQRPLQVTDDLARFWKETYPEIKPALSRRYPRHEWR
jgi:ATP-dependent helicase HrpB